MSKRNYWILFVVMQAAGAILPKLPNVHSRIPLFAGLLLLVPGDLLASIFSGKMSPYFFYPAVFLINAGVWLIVRKILLPSAEPSS